MLTKLDTAMKKGETRLNGDAATKGSIAWLQAQEAALTKAGHTDAAKKVAARITTRTGQLTKLTSAEKDLAEYLSTYCS